MTGTAGCREIRQALGVYVLGAIDPAERSIVDEHLATCPDCREELAKLAGLPALLRRVPLQEAEQLAAADADTDDGLPSEELLPSLVTRAAQVKRARRWRGLAAAAAAVVVALGAGAAATGLLEHVNHPPGVAVHWVRVSVTSRVTGAHLTVEYHPTPGGTMMRVRVSGVPLGTSCGFVVTDSSGTDWPSGGWRFVSGSQHIWFPATTWVTDKNIRGFKLLTSTGHVLAAIRAA